MMRERTCSGKRGQTTKIWPAWSSSAFLQELAPFGSTIDFHSHSRIGVSLRRTLPLISRLSVVLSLWLFRYSARRPSSSTTLTLDRKSTRLNSSHGYISYAVFCLKKKKKRYVCFGEH